jgi:YsiA-like protein
MARAFSPSETEGQGVRWRSLIVNIIEQGKAAGDLRADLDPARAESLLSGVYYAIVYTWANCLETNFDLQAELRAQLDLVFDGLKG